MDAWKMASNVKSMLAAFLIKTWLSYNCSILTLIYALETSWPSTTVDSTFHDLLLRTSRNYHITPTEVAEYKPVLPICFFSLHNCPTTICTAADYILEATLVPKPFILVVYFVWIALQCKPFLFLNFPIYASLFFIARLLLSRWHQNSNHFHISCQTTFMPYFAIVARFLLRAHLF